MVKLYLYKKYSGGMKAFDIKAKPSKFDSLLMIPSRKHLNMNYSQGHKSSGLNKWGDADSDGIPNYKDCKPFDPTKHGILSAIAGAVKGAVSGTGVKSGWSEGMAKPGVIKSIQNRFAERKNRDIPVPVMIAKTASATKMHYPSNVPQVQVRQIPTRNIYHKGATGYATQMGTTGSTMPPQEKQDAQFETYEPQKAGYASNKTAIVERKLHTQRVIANLTPQQRILERAMKGMQKEAALENMPEKIKEYDRLYKPQSKASAVLQKIRAGGYSPTEDSNVVSRFLGGGFERKQVGWSKKTGKPIYKFVPVGMSKVLSPETYLTRKREKGSVRYQIAGGIGGPTYTPSKNLAVSKGRGKGPGRPRESFKPRYHPITGQPVGRMPALQWYKVKRRIIAQARAIQQARMVGYQAQMTARGVPPRFQEQAIAQRRQIAIQQAVQQQMPQQIPTENIPVSVPVASGQSFSQNQGYGRVPERFVTQRDRFVTNRDRFMQHRPVAPLANKGLVMTPQGLMKIEVDLMSGNKRLVPARQVLY